MTPYPVRLIVPPSAAGRNRLTVGFRPILAIPHMIMVGPMMWSPRGGSPGLLGAAAYFLAVVNWVSVVFTGNLVPGIRDFALFYLRWRARATAYQALLVDPYPPFTDGPYPSAIAIEPPAEPRDRMSIAFRAILVIPHLIVGFFLLIAWCVISVVAWCAILFAGQYPVTLYELSSGMLQWLLRVEAYLLLLVDQYPPFELADEPQSSDHSTTHGDGLLPPPLLALGGP
jgi:hypothetical protein